MTAETGDDAPTGLIRDRALLDQALGHINKGRCAPEYSSTRVTGLYAGFERLAAALPCGGRGSATDSLAELESLLGADGPECGAHELRCFLEPVLDRLVEGLLGYPERRLAAYGSLQPGEDQHHRLEMLGGRWMPGTVEGFLHDRGWAERRGYPGYVRRDPGERISLQVFQSAELPGHWPALDAFEGERYRRILASVATEAGAIACNIYEMIEGSITRPP